MSQDDLTGTHDDPKDIGTPEDRACENASRRRFLKGGAVAAVGALALAAVVVPKGAEADVYEPGGGTTPIVRYHPNDQLARTIVRAWKEPQFKSRLLTFGMAPQAQWAAPPQDADYRSAREALREMDLYFDKPVVLTQTQYKNNYTKGNAEETIFVLPNFPTPPVGGGETTGGTARALMAAVPFGM